MGPLRKKVGNLCHLQGLQPYSECSICSQGVVSIVCGTAALQHPSPVCVGLSSTPQQQPDTRDERSRQACKRGVPSRPACLSVCREELQTVKRSRPPRGGSHREISIAYLPLPSVASSGVIFSLCHNPEKLHVLVL